MHLQPLKLNMHILIIHWCLNKQGNNLILGFKKNDSIILTFIEHYVNQRCLSGKPDWKYFQWCPAFLF